MNDEQYHSLRVWFKNHIRSYRESSPTHQRNLDMKEAHTARVVEVTDRLSRALRLSENASRVAGVIALFHDLGRFPQYHRYRTFYDPDSENHAKLSIRELIRFRVLQPLEPAERYLIGRAIIFHNRLRLPDHLDRKTLLHSRLIRDADKIDILRVMADEYRKPPEQQNSVLTLGLEPEQGVRDEVYQKLLNKQSLSYTKLNNANEFKVMQMSWVFDINFLPTFELLRERNDLGIIVSTLPPSAIRDQSWSVIKAYIDRHLTGERAEVAN